MGRLDPVDRNHFDASPWDAHFKVLVIAGRNSKGPLVRSSERRIHTASSYEHVSGGLEVPRHMYARLPVRRRWLGLQTLHFHAKICHQLSLLAPRLLRVVILTTQYFPWKSDALAVYELRW